MKRRASFVALYTKKNSAHCRAAHSARDRFGRLVLVRVPGIGPIADASARERNPRQGIVVLVTAGFADPVVVSRGRHPAAVIVGASVDRRPIVNESRQLTTVRISACDFGVGGASELGQHTYNVITR